MTREEKSNTVLNKLTRSLFDPPCSKNQIFIERRRGCCCGCRNGADGASPQSSWVGTEEKEKRWTGSGRTKTAKDGHGQQIPPAAALDVSPVRPDVVAGSCLVP